MVDDDVGMLDKLAVELLEPVISKGAANEEHYKDIDRLVKEIEKILNSLNNKYIPLKESN